MMCFRHWYQCACLVAATLIALAGSAAIAGAQSISFNVAPYSPLRAGQSPTSVAIGDFNSDGRPDVVVANARDNSASVYLGNGDGTFVPAARSPVRVNRNPFPTPCLFTKCGSVPLAVAVGDFNGDGTQDLAITNIPLNDLCSIGSVLGGICSSVAVLLGNGDGTFQDSNQFDPGGRLPTSVTTGDFNNDGKQDLVVTNLKSSTISILLGDGSGRSFTHASRSPVSVGRGPAWVTKGDFNGDGTLDLAVANADEGTVTILLGNGNGTVSPAAGSPFDAGARPIFIAVADVNRDGKVDLAVADYTDSVVSILLGHGDGTVGTPARFGVGAHPSSIAVADYDTDGNLDLAVANRLGGSLSILKGNGRGSFALTHNESVGIDPQSVATGDFNGDGEPDLIAAIASDNSAFALLNATDVRPPTTVATASPAPNANGWTRTAVAVSLTATDNTGGSGVKALHYRIGADPESVVAGASAAFSITAQTVVPISYYAVDNAGNVEMTRALTVRIDSTPPSISSSQAPSANSAGWNNSNVTVTFSCADALSGIAACTAPVAVTAEGANQAVTGTAIDMAGNSAASTRTVGLDKTAPSLTLPTFAQSYSLNSSLTINFSAADGLSGLSRVSATLNGTPVSAGSTVTLTHAGSNAFTLTAADVAGNTATQTLTFSVLYNFIGFVVPIANDGSTVFRKGATVPVKFQLTDGSGAPVANAVALLTLQLLSNGTPTGAPIDSTGSGAADVGQSFRYDGSHYIYNLDTGNMAVGTWQLRVLLDDGTVHTVNIGLK
jgi:FG-GAP-like repeat